MFLLFSSSDDAFCISFLDKHFALKKSHFHCSSFVDVQEINSQAISIMMMSHMILN